MFVYISRVIRWIGGVQTMRKSITLHFGKNERRSEKDGRRVKADERTKQKSARENSIYLTACVGNKWPNWVEPNFLIGVSAC